MAKYPLFFTWVYILNNVIIILLALRFVSIVGLASRLFL